MYRRGKILNLWLISFFTDFFAVSAAYFFSVWFRFNSGLGSRLSTMMREIIPRRVAEGADIDYATFYLIAAPRIILILTGTICFFYALSGLYEGRRFIRRRPIAWYVIISNFFALVMFYTYFHFTRNIFHPRSIFAVFIVVNITLCLILRFCVESVLYYLREKKGIDRWRTVLMGEGNETRVISELVDRKHPGGIYLIGCSGFNSGDKNIDSEIKKLNLIIEKQDPDMIICIAKDLSIGAIMQMLEIAGKFDVAIKILSSRLDVIVSRARMPADLINGCPLVHFGIPSRSNFARSTKRLTDIVIAFSALVMAFPFLALIALLVKVTSRGPVFFVQERIGVNREPFTIYKFRSMYQQADEMQAQVEEFNESGEGLFKIREDPRVTPVGRFLRRFSLDELPQLLNVIKGDMTLIGPRPLPRRDFENYYETWHYSRHDGLPGLTCLWQVSGRSDVSFRDMCLLDVYYLKNHNWILDIKIALRTIWAVFFAKGAY